MVFFRKTGKQNPITDKAADRFAGAILLVQAKWAAYMNRLTARWTSGQKKLALILFCVVMGANSGIALYKAVNVPGKKELTALRPDRIRELSLPADTLTQTQLQKHRQSIVRVIDSLNSTDSGRLWLSHLQRSRPGLWDSIKLITGRNK